jgi:hypothetical protein
MEGTDNKCNLVDLTPEEHLVAHLLLVKIYPKNLGLLYAAHMMSNTRTFNNKQYGWVKRQLSEQMNGIPRSVESVQKQRETIKQKFENGFVAVSKGNVLSEDHKRKISEANTGKIIPTKSRSSLEGYVLRYGQEEGQRKYDEDRAKKASNSLNSFIKRFGDIDGPTKYKERQERMSTEKKGADNSFFGHHHTEEAKQKQREAKVGKKLNRSPEHNAKIGASNRGKKMPTSACIHCGKVGATNLIHRWHDDNCKHKQIND